MCNITVLCGVKQSILIPNEIVEGKVSSGTRDIFDSEVGRS
jgi:hypothetical protein